MQEPGVQEFIPQCTDDIKPKKGQQFSTREEAYDFYNSYAKVAGFSTRKGSTKYNKKGDAIWAEFLCNKEGESSTSVTTERKRGTLREGCKAKMSIVKGIKLTQWQVSSFVEDHTHLLATPRKVHLLPSHRKVSKATKSLARHLTDANVPTCQQFRMLGIEAGGIQNIGCTERDLRNHERDERDKSKGLDAATFLELFNSEKQKNQNFYFEFDKDEEGRLSRCFWADAEARRSHSFFGDVVVFDTTYNTNKYSLIFAPLVGVNQHGQTVIFGCGFLSNESIDSFVWFFEQWVKSMLKGKGPPQIIITDQDPAMMKAIETVFPNTFHRFCIWHIMNKFQEKLGPIQFRDYYPYFANSVYGSDSVEEFEEKWQRALENSGLHNHPWLSLIYKMREKWVPAYVKHIFAAGMSSSQRAESGHSFLKRYVSKHNSLVEFFTKFKLALESQREQELIEDYNNLNEKPKLKSAAPMEKQMAEVYTRFIFGTFQEESYESIAYSVTKAEKYPDRRVYVVTRAQAESSRVVRLVYFKDFDFVECSCKFFELEGIPCRHMLAFFRLKQLWYLPNQYILQRWTRSAKSGTVWDNIDAEEADASAKSLMTRHAKLSQLCARATDEASLSIEATEMLQQAVDDVVSKIKELHLSKGTYEISKKRIAPDTDIISDPMQARPKGCGSRLKSAVEKASTKARLCRACGLRGQSHDSRNCPKLFDKSNDIGENDVTPLTGPNSTSSRTNHPESF